jgi:16S rRNA U516 pseudouridylate synthase RsuA-like enzyme
VPPATRITRYLAAAGLGTRREVEGLIPHGRVAIDGVAVTHPGERVPAGAVVTLDGEELRALTSAGVALHRPPGAPIELVHPPGIVVVAPLAAERGGLEVLLGDAALARKLSEPDVLSEHADREGRRLRIGPIKLGELPEGEWRPLSRKERDQLTVAARVGVRRSSRGSA